MSKARKTSSKSQGASKAGHREIQLDIPRAFSNGDPYAIWQEGGPGRLLSRLASEHTSGEATLTQDELADLVELFCDEPLPESLRQALVDQLRGKRLRRQGAPKKRQTNLELVEYIMLPGAYTEALKDAEAERESLRKHGRKQGRYDDADRLPTAGSIACNLVRKRLPTLAGLSDPSLLNEVSKVKALLSDSDGTKARSQAIRPARKQRG